jgi:Protein of unknown function (DUF4435)
VRIREIHIGSWRDLQAIDLLLPPDCSLVCLVEEEGQGTSHLLELINLIAHKLGLATQSVDERRTLSAANGHVDIEVTVDISDDIARDVDAVALSHLRQAASSWNGQITVYAHAHQQQLSGRHWLQLRAGGVEGSRRSGELASILVERLRKTRAVPNLYVSAGRRLPSTLRSYAKWLERQRASITVEGADRQPAETQDLYGKWLQSVLDCHQGVEYPSSPFTGQLPSEDGHGASSAFPARYRDALARVLPYLRFVGIDGRKERLIFNNAGTDLPHGMLSAKEREIASMVAQIERLKLHNGLFLIDQPERYASTPRLLSDWLGYLRDSFQTGQVWVATPSVEVGLAANSASTFALQIAEHPRTCHLSHLSDRPTLRRLGHLGARAFVAVRSRLLLIEGVKEGRERERFSGLLDTCGDQFWVAGGCDQVLASYIRLVGLASDVEPLFLGAFIDRDFRTEQQLRDLIGEYRICVLPVHEIENFFLEPNALAAIGARVGLSQDRVSDALRQATDELAGRWIFKRTFQQHTWRGAFGRIHAKGNKMTWAELASDPERALDGVIQEGRRLDEQTRAQYRVALVGSAEAYQRLRQQDDELWKHCFGKETLSRVANALRLEGRCALEDEILQMWRTETVQRPPQVKALRQYLDEIPTLAEYSPSEIWPATDRKALSGAG